MVRTWLLALCVVLWGLGGPARAATPRFDALSDSDALRDNLVTALARDAHGLLWLGTANGLVRFDGYEFKRHGVPSQGEAGGAEQFVRVLLADPAGPVWAGMGGAGLARWDPATAQWTRWQRRDKLSDAEQPSSDSIRALARTADGVIWAGSQRGLDALDPRSGRFQHFTRPEQGLTDARIAALLTDHQGGLWVGTGRGVVRRVGDRFEPVALGGVEPVVAMLAQDVAGRLLIGSAEGGLWRLDPTSGRVEAIEPESRGSGAAAYTSAVQINAEEVWLGTAAALERRRAADLQLLERLSTGGGTARPAPHGDVRALLLDPSGIVWVGTAAQGLMRHLPPRPGLAVLRADPQSWFQRGDWDVRSLLQRRNGQVWLGTQAQGIEILDPTLAAQGSLRPVLRDGDAGLPRGRVSAMWETADESVWVAVETRLSRFDRRNQWQSTLPPARAAIRRLFPARDGGLWLGTLDGLLRWRPGAAELEVVATGADIRDVNGLVELPDGALWLGGAGGLYRRPPGPDDVFVRLDTDGLRSPAVVGLGVDAQQHLWVDTITGLHRLVALDGRRARFEQVLAPADPNAEGAFGANLLFDGQGRVWTHRGVYDPVERLFHALGPTDGVDFGTGWFRAYTALRDGRLLFGGSQGVLVVQPPAFKAWDYAPPVVLTSLSVAGQERPVPTAGGDVVLAPGETTVHFGFAALDYSQPVRLRYRYRLSGLDGGWIEVEAGARRASYTNLAPGHYRFDVQASNRAGVWSPHELHLNVQVQPQWWQALWARLAALAVTAVALGLALRAWLRWRMVRLRAHQLELQAHVDERTEALHSVSQALAEKTRQLEQLTITDPLTGMHNRRFLEQHVPADVALAVRRHEDAPPLSARPAREDLVFFVVDVDHFKRINDSHGHAAGDQVLRGMRERLESVLRASDYALRWGGEEFLFVARGLPREDAGELAHRACQAVASKPFVLGDGVTLNLTCSVGFVAFPPAPRWPRVLSWQQTVDLAEAALAEAKQRGRNGWSGLVLAQADSPEQLRRDAAGGLAAWRASGRANLEPRRE